MDRSPRVPRAKPGTHSGKRCARLRNLLNLCLALTLVLLPGCDRRPQNGAASEPTRPPVLETTEGEAWVLELALVGDSPLEINEAISLTIADGDISWFSGCNSYSGHAGIDPGIGLFRVGEMGTTAVGCGQARDEFENAFHDALMAVTRYRFEDGLLVMTGPEVELWFLPGWMW